MKKLTDYLPERKYGQASSTPRATITFLGDDIHYLRYIADRENMSQATLVMSLLNFYESEKEQ